MTFRGLLIFGLICGASNAAAQAFYESSPSRMIYMPVQSDDLQIFQLNPAALPTSPRKASGYFLRHQRETTYTANDDSKTTTKTTLSEEGYGAGALLDLGAGMAAGLSVERLFSKADVNITSVTRVPYEKMMIQNLSARLLIDLAPGLRVGLILRWLNEHGDIMGSPNASIISDRVQYEGQLIGHGGGVTYSVDKLRIGAAYFPAARGKSEILYEQRIISEPGVALFDGSFKQDKMTIGVGVERAVHRRDERAVTVPSEDGKRNITLDGISPDKNAFPVGAYHAAVDIGIAPQWSLRGGASIREREFVFDDTKVPGDNSSPDRYSVINGKAALRFQSMVDVTAGYMRESWSTTLSGKSGSSRAGSSYKGGDNLMFLSIGSKF